MKKPNLFKTVINYLLLTIITLSLNSCFIKKAIEVDHAKKEFTEQNQAIPPSFGKDNSVIVCILHGRNSYDKYLKIAVEENYKGEYLLIKSADLTSIEYSNKAKYRYVFDYGSGSSLTTIYSNGQSVTTTYKRFFIYDRLEDKKYESGAEFTYFAKAMRVYFANLEIKRSSIK